MDLYGIILCITMVLGCFCLGTCVGVIIERKKMLSEFSQDLALCRQIKDLEEELMDITAGLIRRIDRIEEELRYTQDCTFQEEDPEITIEIPTVPSPYDEEVEYLD
tara:strand:+ start:377 stop:694 length:318 start_codon:yes stop_codon:yes gene_type:complete